MSKRRHTRPTEHEETNHAAVRVPQTTALPQSIGTSVERADRDAGDLLALQQRVGNRAVQRLLAQHMAGNGRVQRALATLTVQRDPEPKKPEVPVKPANELVSAEDEAEFNLLKGKIEDADAAAYVKHRTKFFGSTEAYHQFAEESDEELDGTKRLRKMIELNGEAQTVYYRWVRKAYLKAGVEDVPGLIKRGKSQELKDALAKVQEGYGKAFKSGGFNPRPMKSARYRYRLGTISEHALGNAVDVEDKSNPILFLKDWTFIEKIAEKTIDRAAKRWKHEPEQLWKDVKELNDLFVKNIALEIERVKTKEAAKPAETGAKSAGAKKPPKKKEPADVVFAKHPNLKKWAGGFFTLEWALVNQLHKNGFKWGLTFSNAVDLHHFEL